MKQPRRWAAWLAAILIAASLVAMPREGAAGPPFVDYLPPVNEGEPDVPSAPAIRIVQGRLLYGGRILVTRVGQMPVLLFMPKLQLVARATMHRGGSR